MRDLKNLEDLAFPVQTRTLGEGQMFTNEIVGGMTLKEYIAIELAKGMFSNPAMVTSGLTARALISEAIKNAGIMVGELRQEPESEVMSPKIQVETPPPSLL